MGDFNIDLLKTDIHRTIHEYVDFIYSFSMLPSIYKPTRITATTATCIDNILKNNDNIIIIILSTNLDFISQKNHNKKLFIRENTVMSTLTNFKKVIRDKMAGGSR